MPLLPVEVLSTDQDEGATRQLLSGKESNEKYLILLVEELSMKEENIKKLKNERVLLIKEINKLQNKITNRDSRDKKFRFVVCVIFLGLLLCVKIVPYKQNNVMLLP